MRLLFAILPLVALLAGCLDFDVNATQEARDLRRYAKPGLTKTQAIDYFGTPLAMVPGKYPNNAVECWSYISGIVSWKFYFDDDDKLVNWATDGSVSVGYDATSSPSDDNNNNNRPTAYDRFQRTLRRL